MRRSGRVGADLAGRVPPHAYFLVSAVFHYLGPAFAVLLFANVGVLGVAWLRIASASLVFAVWRRPWRVFARQSAGQGWLLAELRVLLGVMNACLFLGIPRLPLGAGGAPAVPRPLRPSAGGARSHPPTFGVLCRRLPACATAIGVLVLRQIPPLPEVLGVTLIVAGVALHREPLPQAGHTAPAARKAESSAAQSELPVA